MAIETGSLNNSSLGDSIDSKYGVVDILEAGEKSLKSSTLDSFNKKAQCLAVGILTTDKDNDENVEDLPAYSGMFGNDDTSDEDNKSDREDDWNGEDDEMSDSDTLLED